MLTRTIDRSRKERKETVVSACSLFGVSRQVYYRSHRSLLRSQERASKTITLVLELRSQMPRLGARKVYYLLQERLNHIGVGRDKLFAILKANHMLIKAKRNYHKTTDSHHRFHKHKNLVEDIMLSRPEQVWVSDITYIGNRSNHRYLALVTDAYSKKIVGYDLSTSLCAKGAVRALKMGLKQRVYKSEQLIHHSDRGLQYCCDDYQRLLIKRNVRCSMTETYDPYANAIAERVNGILKQEFLLEQYLVKLPVMKELIKDSVRKYNVLRPHWSCYMRTPDKMHKQREIKIKTYKKNSTCQT